MTIVTIIWNCPDCIFDELQLTFCKRYKKVHNDEQVYL
jgi:hypothetical protein